MTPREMLARREKLIGQIVTELIHIQENIPTIIKEIERWPTIAKGPIDDEAYVNLNKVLSSKLWQHSSAAFGAWEESRRLNTTIERLIKKAYES